MAIDSRSFRSWGAAKPMSFSSTAVSTSPAESLGEEPLIIGSHTLRSRLIVGTGKYETFAQMQQALDLSGADCLTVAVRRERL
jgi:hypothetical protein